jgi:hypothetical protein
MCGGEYYIAKALYAIQKQNPETKLMCPYCQKEFPAKDGKFKENA